MKAIGNANRRQPAKKQRGLRSSSTGENPSEHPSQIITRLLLTPIWITEKDVGRQVTAMEALLLQLWLMTLAGNYRAFKLWSRFRQLAPRTDAKLVEIKFEDMEATNPEAIHSQRAKANEK